MLHFFKIIFLVIITAEVQAENVIDNFLNKVRGNSIDYKVVQLENESTQLVNELELSQFDFNGSIKGEYSESKNVLTSPFSADTSESYTYSLGLNKKWAPGFETALSYSLLDNLVSFPSRADLDYLSPDLSLSLKTNLVQDLFYGQSRSIKKKVESLNEASLISAQIQKKSIFIKSLLELSQILEVNEEVNLQGSLCKEIASQVRKLREKSKRGSVAKRDYLLSLKNNNNCKLTQRNLSSNLKEMEASLINDFGVTKNDIANIKVNQLFNEIISEYDKNNLSTQKINLSDHDSVRLYKAKLNSSKLKGDALRAKTKLPLSFELKFGLRGLDEELDKSHEAIIDTSNPYVMGNLELKLPFINRQAKSDLKINSLEQEILRSKITKENSTVRYRFKLLKENIDLNLKNYKSNLKNVSLSRSVLREARRDFNNGRVDFLTLSEYQKGLIESQKSLGQVRMATMIIILDYLDYFNYFDRYYAK